MAVHHHNRQPEDNRPENLIALCSACHLERHKFRLGSVSIGQLSLF
ncbi:MAG: HNH endonuclease [Microcystis panniformis]